MLNWRLTISNLKDQADNREYVSLVLDCNPRYSNCKQFFLDFLRVEMNILLWSKSKVRGISWCGALWILSFNKEFERYVILSLFLRDFLPKTRPISFHKYRLKKFLFAFKKRSPCRSDFLSNLSINLERKFHWKYISQRCIC